MHLIMVRFMLLELEVEMKELTVSIHLIREVLKLDLALIQHIHMDKDLVLVAHILVKHLLGGGGGWYRWFCMQ